MFECVTPALVDRRQTKIGKVRGRAAPGRAAAHRLDRDRVGGARAPAWAAPRAARLSSLGGLGGEAHREPYRVPWQKVRDIGVDIELDLEVHETTIFDWQDWLRDHVIGKIPGA